MAYKTTQAIRDTQDNDFYYREGDEFPRNGLKVSDERLDELVKGGYIVSDEVVEATVENETDETDLTKLKKDELIGLADQKGVEVSNKDTKAEIIEKLGE